MSMCIIAIDNPDFQIKLSEFNDQQKSSSHGQATYWKDKKWATNGSLCVPSWDLSSRWSLGGSFGFAAKIWAKKFMVQLWQWIFFCKTMNHCPFQKQIENIDKPETLMIHLSQKRLFPSEPRLSSSSRSKRGIQLVARWQFCSSTQPPSCEDGSVAWDVKRKA